MGRKTLILITVVILCSSCRLEQNIDFDFPIGEVSPIVEAYLVDGEEMQISLSRSNTLYETVRFNPIWNADVYIISDGDSIKLRNILKYDEVGGRLYNYIHDSIVRGNVDDFELLIESEEFGTMRAQCSPVEPVFIEEIELDEFEVLKVSCRNVSEARNNYYQLRLSAYYSGELEERMQVEFDYYDMSEGEVAIYYPIDFRSYDSLDVELSRIDSLCYVYQRSVWNALNANMDPYTTPSPIFGNIDGALGVFACIERDSRMLHISSSD